MYTGIGQDEATLLGNCAAVDTAMQPGIWAPIRLRVPLTPLDVVRQWPAGWPLAVLHSGRLHRQWARWTVLARPSGRLVHAGGTTVWQNLNGTCTEPPGPLTHEAVDDLQRAVTDGSVWIGSLSYDLGDRIEPAAAGCTRGSRRGDRRPVCEWQRCPEVLLYDHETGEWSTASGADKEFVSEICRLAGINSAERSDDGYTLGSWQFAWGRARYEDAVARVIEYIRAGDIFQANLTQQMSAAFSGSARRLFVRAMERGEPWYAAYLEMADGHNLISQSPELFLSFDSKTRLLTTRPIKGTLPGNLDADELVASVKDAAELNMIVDLMRNDLGRVCDFGSVQVVGGGRTIESHPTVHHGVATVQGRVRDGLGLGDVLRATFPAGSITGAPKIRAMQIIRELEQENRGPFFGSVGMVMPDGSYTLNVSIRTMVIENGCARYAAGGGIVADSVPALEYEEMLAKTAVVQGLVTEPDM